MSNRFDPDNPPCLDGVGRTVSATIDQRSHRLHIYLQAF